jgi:hypothetical protein
VAGKGVATGPSGRGTLQAQNAEQPELGKAGLVETISADQGAVSVGATKAVSPLVRAAGYRPADRDNAVADGQQLGLNSGTLLPLAD